MKNRIVIKLFLLTTALCMFILATILFGQIYFFKKYYAARKVEDMKASITAFKKAYLQSSGKSQVIQKLERDFYQNKRSWIVPLDQYGNLVDANGFDLEIQLAASELRKFPDENIRFPMDYLVDKEESTNIASLFPIGMKVSAYGIKKGKTFIPYALGKLGTFPPGTLGALTPAQLQDLTGQSFWENKILENEVGKRLYKQEDSGPKPQPQRSKQEDRKSRSGISNQNTQKDLTAQTIRLNGTIKKVNESKVDETLPYSNDLFLNRMKTFQAQLLFNNVTYNFNSFYVLNYEKNDNKYKIFIQPFVDKNGQTLYLFSMTSLQPVDEAVQMLKDYYVYITGFVLLLILFTAFYYSKKIANPLLRINRITKKIANLNFSETVPITSKDEIGDLSRNINLLSRTLHSHITQLQQDIEKEKRLENTRKEFIAGVSHELKTPLSIMKSCITILRDGVAKHKKGYYLEALDKEVDKMNVMVMDMLELAKFESGTYKMKMDPFYINRAIDSVCEQLRLEMENKDLTIQKVIQPIEVVANRHRIEQVLTNFLTNAIRYTPKGHDIIITTEEKADQVKVGVENKGTYIDPEQIHKVWDRFYRGDASRRRSKGGTGLGLAISKNILEMHHVIYGAENTDDGVLFYFHLNKK
ncbi:two-component sensor histidine kinase [Pullulanibacillus camelliae]|uniref:histidine kinase n=1 Tax=Pullulanibacillus camelliae TaxID=1707096 RepID=A0A8J2YLV8_9BACL|nr:HAMP domain-containing sensor histidine kinase [Pullulanibacillus camelliae]GGE51830.1 two-component sensor histidine kinase [Pullulanibacillus camelliae]